MAKQWTWWAQPHDQILKKVSLHQAIAVNTIGPAHIAELRESEKSVLAHCFDHQQLNSATRLKAHNND
jgi:hypothetical protein